MYPQPPPNCYAYSYPPRRPHHPSAVLLVILAGLTAASCVMRNDGHYTYSSSGHDPDRDLPVKRPIDLTWAIPVAALKIDADDVWGNVTLSSSPTVTHLRITGTLREKTENEATIDLTPTGPHITSHTDPKARFDDLTIEVPPGTDLHVAVSYGNVTATHLAAANSIDLHSAYGNVTLDGATPVKSIRLTSSSGQVTARNLQPTTTLTLDSSYGDVTLDSTAALQTLSIETSSGNVTAAHVKSVHDATLHSGYGDVRATDLTGDSPAAPLRVTSSSGAVRLQNIRAATLTAKSGYGDVSLDDAADLPAVTLDSSSGTVSAHHLDRAGDLALSSGYGDAKLTAIPAAKSVTVHCLSGNIACTDLTTPKASLDTGYGNITLNTCTVDQLHTHTPSGSLRQSNVTVAPPAKRPSQSPSR